ncbi:MAG: rRNA large subunit methyltransferase I, partial [bacterium]|nr:rRNA large subunit methyltransferase I [bacterium]
MSATVFLRKDRRPRVEMGHPWIFQSEIGKIRGNYAPGDIVRVVNNAGAPLGVGYINPLSQIIIRLLTRREEVIDRAFFERRICDAYSLRKAVVGKDCSAYRLVYGEADYLPGITVDIYGAYAVMQVLTLGMERWTDTIASICVELLSLKGVILRNDVSVREIEGLSQEVRFLGAEFNPRTIISENGFLAEIDLIEGQKTGYFLDQRENRAY